MTLAISPEIHFRAVFGFGYESSEIYFGADFGIAAWFWRSLLGFHTANSSKLQLYYFVLHFEVRSVGCK
jgi:hypothetical protein